MGLQENLNLAQQIIAAIDRLNYNSSNRGAQLDGPPPDLSDTRGDFANFMYERTASVIQADANATPPGALSQDPAPFHRISTKSWRRPPWRDACVSAIAKRERLSR